MVVCGRRTRKNETMNQKALEYRPEVRKRVSEARRLGRTYYLPCYSHPPPCVAETSLTTME